MTTRGIVYDYYDVDIPSDFSTDPKVRGQQAFIEAEERTRLWFSVANWRVLRDDGKTVRVCRERYATEKDKIEVVTHVATT